MATGSIPLMPGSADLPDQSASNLAPILQRVKSSAAAPGDYFIQALFDAAPASDQWMVWGKLVMPANYASSPVAKIAYKMVSAVANAVVWDVRVGAVTPGDATDLDAKGFAAANKVTQTVPGTAGHVAVATVTLTNNDSLAAGDVVSFRVARASFSDAADTASGGAELVSVTIEYTTT